MAVGSHFVLQEVHIVHRCFATSQSTHRGAGFHALEPLRQDHEATEEANVRASRSTGVYAAEIALYLKARWDLLVMRMDRIVQAA
jgi:hypothetical protein